MSPIQTIYVEERPWGKFTQYTHNVSTTVKIIEVNPNQKLSLQFHHHRDELWIPLDEGLTAEVNGQAISMVVGVPVWVPRETKHRVYSDRNARFLEIAFGYFDENDIVRIDDQYGRK